MRTKKRDWISMHTYHIHQKLSASVHVLRIHAGVVLNHR